MIRERPFRERVAKALYELQLRDQVVPWDYDDPIQQYNRERYLERADLFILKVGAKGSAPWDLDSGDSGG